MGKAKSAQKLAKVLAETVPHSTSQNTHVHATAKVVSIHGNTANCKILGRNDYQESTILQDVLIADSAKWIPVSKDKNEELKPGDTVYIGFSDHDLSNFNGSNSYVVDTDRRHDLSDGIIETVITHG